MFEWCSPAASRASSRNISTYSVSRAISGRMRLTTTSSRSPECRWRAPKRARPCRRARAGAGFRSDRGGAAPPPPSLYRLLAAVAAAVAAQVVLAQEAVQHLARQPGGHGGARHVAAGVGQDDAAILAL